MTVWSETRLRLVCAAIVAIVAFAVFAPSLRTRFVYDDFTVVTENTELPNLLKAKNYFTQDYFRYSGETTYRPLVTASYALDYRFWGKNPFGYHLTNLFWHTAACVAFFLLCVSLRAPHAIASVAALIYASHPIRSEGVVGIGFREDLLCAAFYLAALALWPGPRSRSGWADEKTVSRIASRRASGTKRKRTQRDAKPASGKTRLSGAGTESAQWLRFSGAMFLYAMALLSKEMALSLPIMALAKEIRLRRLANGSKRDSSWKPILIRQAGAWLLTFSALALYMTFTSDKAPVDIGNHAGVLTRLGAFAWVSLRYIRLFLVPYPLCVEYVIDMKGILFGCTAVGSVAVVALLGVLAWRLRRRFSAGLESFLAFYILLGPVSSLIPIFNPMAERYLTIPTAAFAWLAAHLIGLIARRRVRWIVAALLVSTYGFLSWVRIEDWRDTPRLWLGVVFLGNETPRVLNNLGRELYERGRGDEALDWYYRAIEIDPEYYEARINIGAALFEKGAFAEAVANYEVALRNYPNPDVGEVVPAMLHNNIANALYRLGELEKAYPHYQEAVRILPRMREPFNNLASVLSTLGRNPEAVALYRKAIRNDPYWEVPYRNLAVVLGQMGRDEEALMEFRRALAVKPDYFDARLGLARLLARTNRTKDAIEEYRRVLQLAPGHPGATEELNRLLQGTGQPSDLEIAPR
ncbi:tetratricopeptide repeat protein [Candidatus Sumerlaeota bacterium]|nr:tetratricopeptide repeat protein [Candidatus Sumerlaeota bacterium]